MRDAAELALQLIGGEEVNRAMQMTKVLTAEIDDLIKVTWIPHSIIISGLSLIASIRWYMVFKSLSDNLV